MLGQEQKGPVKHNWWMNSVRRFLCRNSLRRSESKLDLIVQTTGLILLFPAQYSQIMLQWQEISNSEQTFLIMNACAYVSLLMFLYGRDERPYNLKRKIRNFSSSLKKSVVLLTVALLALIISQVAYLTKKIINLQPDMISAETTRDLKSNVNQTESSPI